MEDLIQEEELPQDMPNLEMWQQRTDVQQIKATADKIRQSISSVIIGQKSMIDQLVIALLTEGHVLIEGVPGVAKTLTAKLLAKTLSLNFNRIQFTPDLMPSDVLGTSVFNVKESDFYFRQGPIFANIVLIDEINRSPAKTQAALFEIMEEKQASIDSQVYPMPHPFFVVATQNPVEQEGTYRLPEAQLDRFIFKIKIGYPTMEEEISILTKFKDDFQLKNVLDIKPVVDAIALNEAARLIEKVYIKDELIRYIAELIDNTRNNPDLYLGASPRASLAILKTSKAKAAIEGRDFVTPDDIKSMCYPVLNHRIILHPDKEMEGYTEEDVIKEIIEKVEVPR
jgi:MoxR-like ATPase